jgi:hypothetical protein
MLVVVLAILALLLWRWPVRHQSVTKQLQQQIGNSNVPMANAANARQSTSSVATVGIPSGTNFTIIESPLHKQLQTPEGFQKYVEEKNVPIEFFGKIIDQDSNALAGAVVKSVIRHWTAPVAFQMGSKDIPVERISDKDGRFEINGETGDGFDIAVTKDGYDAEPGQHSFGAVGGSFDNPVVFKMWSTNIHEKLIGGGKSFDIVPDGRRYFINLTDDTISESGQGDLRVWIKYTNQVVRGQVYDWSAEIAVINGGLSEVPLGTAMYQAPTDGYVPSYQSRQQIEGGQRGSTGEHQFYLLLKNGQQYGQMSIGLYAPFNNQTPGLIRLTYAINPSGSRILR